LGFAEHESDIRNFKSFEYDLVEFDELTSFTESMYVFMFSRNRTKTADLPPLLRSASNPGDIGHQWVFDRFIAGREPFKVYEVEIKDPISGVTNTMPRQFIPAKVWDNPKMPNMAEYITGLMAMGEADAAAYLHGIWTMLEGQMFRTLPELVPAGAKGKDYYVIRCMDYGYEDQTCILWLYCYPNNVVEVAHELYVKHATVEGIATLAAAAEKDIMGFDPNRLYWSVADPNMFINRVEGAQNIAFMLSQQGLMFTKANNDRVAGWARIRELIGAGNLRVWQGRCPNLMRTLASIQRNPKMPDDAKKYQEDHAPDTLRYGVMAFYDRPPIEPLAPRPNPNQDHYYDELRDNLTNKGKRDIMADMLNQH